MVFESYLFCCISESQPTLGGKVKGGGDKGKMGEEMLGVLVVMMINSQERYPSSVLCVSVLICVVTHRFTGGGRKRRKKKEKKK